MPRTAPPLLRRLAGAAAAPGLALAGLVLAAAPASAAACSGTSGVTVVVDTGSSTSTKCVSGDPSSALKALTGAGYSVTYPVMYPGTVICQINGYPASACQRMPPADAYWAFFHAKRGGSWTYSSSGVASYNPAPGTVVGFRFGSGQQPRVAPPAPTATSQPAATTTAPKTTSTPKKTTSAPAPKSAPTKTSGSTSAPVGGSTPAATRSASSTPSPSTSVSTVPSATATAPASTSATTTGSPTTVAAAPSSEPSDGTGTGTLLAGGALVALVAAGAGYAAWTRRD